MGQASEMQPAAIRYNNPGAQYPGPSSRRFGSTGFGVIGGGHKIAAFSSPLHGAAAQYDLLRRNYAGMPLGSLIHKWSGGNDSKGYTDFVSKRMGLTPSSVITGDMLRDPNFAVKLAQTKSQWETGDKFPLNEEQWRQAHGMAYGGVPAAGSFRAAQETSSSAGPAPQVAGYVARDTDQGQNMASQQQPSLFGALAKGFSSPQFMAGAAMFDSASRGGGISQGAQMLQQAQQREEEMAYRQAQQQRADAIRQQQFAQQAPLNAAKLKLYEAQAAKAAGAPGPEGFGKSGAIFQGQDGIFRGVQFGENGSVKIHPFDVGMSPARGVETVDEGTGTRIINKSTGADVRRIDKDLAGEAREKKIGQNQGDLIANKTKTTMGARSKLQQGGLVFDAVDKALEAANWTGSTGLIGSATKNVPPLEGVWAAPAYTLSKRLDTVKANIGFDKLQDMRDNSPTGGALGQVSTFELEMLQGVWGSVEQAQGRAELVRNLQNFKRIYRGSMQRIKDAYEMDYGKGSFRGLGMGPSTAASPGSPATNPAAGTAAPAPRQSGVPEHPLLKKYGIE